MHYLSSCHLWAVPVLRSVQIARELVSTTFSLVFIFQIQLLCCTIIKHDHLCYKDMTLHLCLCTLLHTDCRPCLTVTFHFNMKKRYLAQIQTQIQIKISLQVCILLIFSSGSLYPGFLLLFCVCVLLLLLSLLLKLLLLLKGDCLFWWWWLEEILSVFHTEN